MAKPRKVTPVNTEKSRPALTPEARENQMIALAVDYAEQQMRAGTASSQIVTHYLKLASEKHKQEMEKLKRENELLRAKTEALQSAKNVEELYAKAIAAMASYRGMSGPVSGDDYDDEYDY